MFTYTKYKNGRYFAVWSPDNDLIVVTVYKKGARAVANLLNIVCHLVDPPEPAQPEQ